MRLLLSVVLSLFVSNVVANTTLNELATLERQKVPVETTVPTVSNQAVNAKHALILIFSSTCHFCQAFAPIVHVWSQQHHVALFTYTTNGQGLPDLPHPDPIDVSVKKAYFADKPVVVPACFILNTQTGKAYPVSVGALSAQEFNLRMDALMPKINAYERGVQS
jgi:type-F conjugative transfer system pilin assembly thiol-disulfide isomerase TrbB